eukprot:TRINITY_DN23842_c0_g1_i1.p1 TRINITY_DN23842_c0_g1~~TRINITY_DN23842_c0_g1_i1.p1  ORF type:complete len:236 (-),score=15.19 TRINITY_DN23842_c0_g1_i1:25-732(-)
MHNLPRVMPSIHASSIKKPRRELDHPRRLQLITEHREDIMKYAKSLVNGKIKWSLSADQKTLTTKNTKKAPRKSTSKHKAAKLSPAKLLDLPLHLDRVYSDKIIVGTLIEEVFVPHTGAYSLFEDEDGTVERIAFYNFPCTTLAEARKLFPVGATISVSAPYIRQAQDGKSMIRVDDPATVEFTERNRSVCWFCWNELSKPMLCGKCRKAMYCGALCQERDWKELGHQRICEFVK